MTTFFQDIPAVTFEGENSDNPFAFRHYDPTAMIDGKSLEDHLRFSVAWRK